MNYKVFIQAVDKKLSEMSDTEKAEWIRNVARTTKEKQRVAFIESFEPKLNEKDFTFVLKEIYKWCEEIENGEIYLGRSSYEVYGERYWDRDYEFEYTDDYNIGKKIKKSFEIAEELLFQRQYKRAVELYEHLCSMSFSVYDDEMGEDGEDLELEELVAENLVSLNLKQIVINLLYAKYQTTNGHIRNSDLYRYFTWEMSNDVKIEEIFIAGPEELSGINPFIKEWVSFLQMKDGDLAAKLLMDACLYYGGTNYLLEIAKATIDKHPILYKNVCERLLNEQRYYECEKTGLEAINKLPENLTIRADIAILTAAAAKQLGNLDVVHSCYEAAFYSNITIINYLRLFDLPNYKKITNSAAMYANLQPTSNIWEKNNQKIIHFFNSDFENIYKMCKKDKSTLGWSNHFKGIIVPLFLLLLNRNNNISNVGQRLIDGIRHRIDFAGTNTEKFEDLFLVWKGQAVLTKEQYKKYINFVSELVDERVEAIVGGGYRTSYHKAALLIVGLGEVLQSHGSLSEKMKLIEHYKKIHSRKRAFRAELEELI